MATKATRRKAAVHYAAHSLSGGNLKNLMPRSFIFVCQLYCCSSKHNNNKVRRITFTSYKTVSTSSMTLATVKAQIPLGSTRLDSTRHIRRVEPMHFGCVELVEQHSSTRSTRRTRLVRLARHVELDRRYLQLSYDHRNSCCLISYSQLIEVYINLIYFI